MSRKINVVWDYFEKVGNNRKAICRLCDEEYSYSTTTGNLKTHLKKKHADTFIDIEETREQTKLLQNELSNDGKERVIYEYVIAPASPASSKDEPGTLNASKIQSRESRASISGKRHKLSQQAIGKAKAKRLIEELTEEKICVTNLQKELIEKEMEEKNLKIYLLQEETAHKKAIYELEKEEIEHRREEMVHKKQMNELAKQEMVLKIELLNAKLRIIKKPDPDLPIIE